MRNLFFILLALTPMILLSQSKVNVIDYSEAKALNIPDQYINPNGKVLIDENYLAQLKSNKQTFDEPDEIDNWPVGAMPGTTARANRSYDLDGDGTLELIVGSGYDVFIFDINGDVWDGWPVSMNYAIGGAPSIGNVDDDPEPEIIVTTNYSGISGQLYVMDIDGTVKPGFPIDYDGAPQHEALLENIDGDPEYEILVSIRSWPLAQVIAYNGDGSIDPFWENVTLDYIPGCALSSGDVNGDGVPEIVACSYWAMHVFDIKANYLEGWPFVFEQDVRGVSYSNPVLADIDEDGLNEIIVGTVNEQPQTDAGAVFALNGDGSLVDGWPQYLYNWVYSPVAVGDLDQDGHLDIVIGDNVLSDVPADYLWAWDRNGDDLPGFPRSDLPSMSAQPTIADIDGDFDMEILYDNNMYMNPYQIFHHDATDFETFELDPGYGVFYNSLLTRDLNGDGYLNIMLSANDFNNNECYHHIYDLAIPYNSDYIEIETHQYNSRNTGEYGIEDIIIGMPESEISNKQTQLYPNPFDSHIYIDGLDMEGQAIFSLYNTLGELVIQKELTLTPHTRIDFNDYLPTGLYLFELVTDRNESISGKITR